MKTLEHTKRIINLFFYDYFTQPAKVTINNIVKEFPSKQEIIIPPIIKTYSISCASNIFSPLTGISTDTLRSDATHWGGFFQNLISASKNSIFWLTSSNFGSRPYQLYHPLSDLLKGGCKMSFLYAGSKYNNKHFQSPLLVNSVCEFGQKFFLTGMDEIGNRNLNHYNLSSWYESTSNLPFWISVTRKAVFQSITAKFIQNTIITPFTELSSPIAKLILKPEWFNYLSTDHAINVEKISIPYLPSVGIWARETLTAGILIPLTRSVIYTINPQVKVLVEKDGELTCERIGDIIKIAQANKVTIEYKYDALKHKVKPTEEAYICEYNKEFTSLNLSAIGYENQIIVHYARSDDFVAKLIGQGYDDEL